MTRRPSRGRARRNRPAEESSAWPSWLGVGAIGTLVLGGLGWAAISTRDGTRYGNDLCSLDGPSAVTAVLIDATDSISPVQKLAVTNRLTRISGQLIANERLAIFEISSTGEPLQPVLSICRPATAAETSELTGNRRLAALKYEDTFQPAVANALDSLLGKAPAERSPIMEGIQASSIAALQAPDVPQSAPRRLVVVSDMMEHAAGGSHYDGVPDFGAYRRTSQFAHTTSDLTDVKVVVLYLRRPNADAVQGGAHRDFWTQWFDAQGVGELNAVPIEG